MQHRSGQHLRERSIILIAVVIAVAALRATYSVSMPVLFAGVIVAALWPLKLWLDRGLPGWLSYMLTIVVLVALLIGFATAVYLSLGQVIGAISVQWPAIQNAYASLADRATRWGVPLDGRADQGRIIGVVGMVASGMYSFATYTGFIGLLVVLGLPEVARWRSKMQYDLSDAARHDVQTTMASISTQVRRYLATTLATSVLTGLVSALWAVVTGLDLALVWGLLNFLLNFVPVVGNIIGIIPPTLYAFVQFGGWGMPLLVFVGYAALQIVISNFVYPLLQGRQLSLSPLVIVLAMTFWGWMWGIAGALIAVPLTAAAVIVCSHFDQSRWVARLLSA